MLRNPIHLRTERLEARQHLTFMASLCERMYPNYQMFCKQTEFGDPAVYRRILDLVWETLVVKDAKVNFDSQLEKLEEAIPSAEDYDLYGVYPAIDACIALGTDPFAARRGDAGARHRHQRNIDSHRGDVGNDPSR